MNCSLSLVFFLVLFGLSGQAAPNTDPGAAIEITQVDLFSMRHWDATQVRIYGLGLRMSRAEAIDVLRSKGLRLMQSGPPPGRFASCSTNLYCFVAGKVPYINFGVSVTFSGEDRISELDIEVDTPTKPAILEKLKGETGKFMQVPYSDEFRRRLFGPEARVDEVSGRYGEKIKDTNYIYSEYGLIIATSPIPGVSGQLKRVELTDIKFIPPQAARAGR